MTRDGEKSTSVGFKLYRSGEFFDLSADWEEQKPLVVASLRSEAAAAAKRLQGALDQFNGVRPTELDRPIEKVGKGKRKGKKNPE